MKPSIFFFNAVITPAAEANGVTVTRIGNVTPGSVKRRQNKPSYFYRLSDILVGNLSLETAACSDAQYLSPRLLLQFQRVDSLTNY